MSAALSGPPVLSVKTDVDGFGYVTLSQTNRLQCQPTFSDKSLTDRP